MSARIAGASDVPAILDDLLASEFVAIDTEFHPERRYLPQLYLVQLATARGAWLLDPLEPEPLLAIGPALLQRTWLVHSGMFDLRLLERALGGVSSTVIDVQVAAGLVSVDYPAPLGGVLARYLNVNVAKGETLSDWSRRPLSREQLAYAAEDVLLLGALWAALRARLEALDRLEIAYAAFKDAWKQAVDPDTTELWREFGGSSTLNGRAATTLRALAAWRDEAARAEDQPARSFVPDGVLMEMARQAPTNVTVLQRDRRLSRSVVKRYADAIIDVIARAQDAPPPAIAPRGSPAWRIATLLEATAEAAGAAASWAPRLVAPRARLEAIAAESDPSPATIARVLGWRHAIAGEVLLDALSGRIGPYCYRGDVVLGAPSDPAPRAR